MPSVIAGATATTALRALLLILGAGIGLSSVSPWFRVGMANMAVGVPAVIWLIFPRWISAGVGKAATNSATAVIARSENAGDSMGYYVDSLFRSTPSIGAFVASSAAAFGGTIRDKH